MSGRSPRRSAERRSTGFGAGSRARRTLAGRRHLLQSPLGIIEQAGAAARARQPPLEDPYGLGQVILLLTELGDGAFELGGRRFVIHASDIVVRRHSAFRGAPSAGCRRISASAAMRPRMPLTNLPESGPPKVFASSIDSLMAALSGTLGR